MTITQLRKVDTEKRKEKINELTKYIAWLESGNSYHDEHKNNILIDWAESEIRKIKKSMKPPKKRKKSPL